MVGISISIRPTARNEAGGVLHPPAGYVLLTDFDGAYLLDDDGAYLMEPL